MTITEKLLEIAEATRALAVDNVELKKALDAIDDVSISHDMTLWCRNTARSALTTSYADKVVVDKNVWEKLASTIKAMEDTARSVCNTEKAEPEMTFEDGVICACSTLRTRLDALRQGGEG